MEEHTNEITATYVDTFQNKTAFCPVTKEQRDQLEKTMANAGFDFRALNLKYEWDVEKKEKYLNH